MNKFAVIDVETTGPQTEGHKIIEIAILCVDDNLVTEEWSSFLNPERPIPWSITRLTGINSQMTSDAPKFYQVARKIVELTEGRILVAHNVFFDYRFLQREFNELGFSFIRDVVCTVRLFRKNFPGLTSYSLGQLSKEFEIEHRAKHRALDDAKVCYELLKLVFVKEKSFSDLRPLPPLIEEANLKIIPHAPGTYFFFNEKGILLYVGKAKSLKHRVFQHFQTVGKSKREMQLRLEVARVEVQEWGSDIAALVMELHFIKSLSPLLNRAGRKKSFPYSLSFHPRSSSGDEIRVTTSKVGVYGEWGTKKTALKMKNKIYFDLFGLHADSLFFEEDIKKIKYQIGEEVFLKRIQSQLVSFNFHLKDQQIPLPGRSPEEKAFLVISEGKICELKFIKPNNKEETFFIHDYPDMRKMLHSYFKRELSLV
jgi:DNA polymerase III epsilon subunit family exonuclease